MKKIGLFLLLGVSLSWLVSACQGRQQEVRKEVPLDSIVLSDPCILADRKTAMYYMTGTGGMLWKSKDLKLWEGPFHVAKTDSNSWMGPDPMVWAAELHPYKGKYYYFATFTNQAVKIDTVQGNVIERRASHVLVSAATDSVAPERLLTERIASEACNGMPTLVYVVSRMCGSAKLSTPSSPSNRSSSPSVSISTGSVVILSSISP